MAANTKFGLLDYIAMMRARGPKLVWAYFWQNHWFDLRHGTQTHSRIKKSEFPDQPKNFKHGVLYMSSWTKTIEESTRWALDHSDSPRGDIALIDVGCGKGKVMCVWSVSRLVPCSLQKVGIEYSAALAQVCRNNLAIINAENVTVQNADATDVNYNFHASTYIMYLYNPFDPPVLTPFLKRLPAQKSIYIIYNNPLHSQLIEDAGFSLIKLVATWHPNASYNIYYRTGA